jgi:hypothetical protein
MEILAFAGAEQGEMRGREMQVFLADLDGGVVTGHKLLLVFLYTVHNEAVEIVIAAGAGKIPAEVRLALAAGGDAPEVSHKPAIGGFRAAGDIAAQRVGKAAYMKAEAVWIGEMVIEAAIYLHALCGVGDDMRTGGAVDETFVIRILYL